MLPSELKFDGLGMKRHGKSWQDLAMLHGKIVVDKTRDSTTSKICPFLLTLIAHVESGQILMFVESLVLSTTIF